MNSPAGRRALCLGAFALTVVAVTAPPASAQASHVVASGAFAPPAEAVNAYAYDTSLIPEGATVRLRAVYTASGSTVVTLHVKGLVPNREYGAHAHVNECGPTGAAAGAHFQHVVDPVTPSTNPAYANPDNEIWLDFTTDDEGSAAAQTVVRWQFDERRAHSVVIHYEHTRTGPTDSGVAGPRLGCLTVPF